MPGENLEGMVAGKSAIMKPIESECFVPEFRIFQVTCRASQDKQTSLDRATGRVLRKKRESGQDETDERSSSISHFLQITYVNTAV